MNLFRLLFPLLFFLVLAKAEDAADDVDDSDIEAEEGTYQGWGQRCGRNHPCEDGLDCVPGTRNESITMSRYHAVYPCFIFWSRRLFMNAGRVFHLGAPTVKLTFMVPHLRLQPPCYFHSTHREVLLSHHVCHGICKKSSAGKQFQAGELW